MLDLGSVLKPNRVRFKPGFTLAELLIALAILGVIATFTIPKLLQAQQNQQKIANAKETAAMIAGAYQQAQSLGVITSASTPSSLTPYMNYVSLESSGVVIDAHPLAASRSCNGVTPCIRLHNGGMLWLDSSRSFGGTSTLHCIEFSFDPDPQDNMSSTGDAPQKAVQFTLYYNGFLTTRGQAKAGTTNSGGGWGLSTAYDPSWFSW